MIPAHAPLQANPSADDAAQSPLLTRLIAYLSVYMLAAAFGALVGPAWCRWWAIFGAFGLVSSTGLDALYQSRVRLEADRRRKRIALVAGRKLDEIRGGMESNSAIFAALRQLQPDPADPAAPNAGHRPEPRLPLDKPATITRLLRPAGGSLQRMGEPLAGLLRNVSRHGVGLSHDRRLERGLVLLELNVENGEPLRFIADLLWCELQESGCYYSGGKILELLRP
jgi:hypothetical protein